MAALWRDKLDNNDCFSLTDSYSPISEATSFDLKNVTDQNGTVINYLVLTWA